ncbi:putative flap endonuclease-1-like 5' DNA nuclease [Sphingomonas zeicaulis]|uniref:hypothetical protein n=1 Tax=Sphingomonas zeicaulis TaxID=1632740 RepID=UPI003D22104E
MQENLWLLIAIAVLALIVVLFFVLRRYGKSGKSGRVTPPAARLTDPGADPDLDERTVVIPAARAYRAPAPVPPPAPAPEPAPLPEMAAPAGPPDDLSRIKGVGPKLVAMLNALGITRYDQIARWTPTDIAAIDTHLGAFSGRPTRDKWVEQAGFLASGDIAGFEARFGKL